jgi:hypothetical protein
LLGDDGENPAKYRVDYWGEVEKIPLNSALIVGEGGENPAK